MVLIIKKELKSVEPIIDLLLKTDELEVQFITNYLHMLADTKIGADYIGGFSDIEMNVVTRISILKQYADVSIFTEKNSNGDTLHLNVKVRRKALQVLAGLLKGADDIDKRGKIVHSIPINMLYELLRFFSIEEHIPNDEPAKEYVKTFLKTVYCDIVGKNSTIRLGQLRFCPLPAEQRKNLFIKEDFYKAVLVPLILIGETSLFISNKDFSACPHLRSYVMSYGAKNLPNVAYALEFWHNRNALKYNAAQTFLTLMAMQKTDEE